MVHRYERGIEREDHQHHLSKSVSNPGKNGHDREKQIMSICCCLIASSSSQNSVCSPLSASFLLSSSGVTCRLWQVYFSLPLRRCRTSKEGKAHVENISMTFQTLLCPLWMAWLLYTFPFNSSSSSWLQWPLASCQKLSTMSRELQRKPLNRVMNTTHRYLVWWLKSDTNDKLVLWRF